MNRAGPDRRLILGVAALVAGVAVWLAFVLFLVWSSLSPQLRLQLEPLLRQALGSAAVLLAVLAVAGTLVSAWAVQALLRHFVKPAARLAEEGRLLVVAGVERGLKREGSSENRALAEVIEQLVAQCTRLRTEMGARVAEASQGIEQERRRLAALMSELAQSVVVCNLDGRILLYNQRARSQFRALSLAPEVADGAELIGLGRSIYSVFDRKLVAHALESIQQRMLRGVSEPSAQFVTTTAAGQLLRVQMAPVRSVQSSDPQQAEDDLAELSGFVLLLDNITQAFEIESVRDHRMHTLTETSRSALANMLAALDVLDDPDLEAPVRDRFQGVIRDEVRSLAQRVSSVETTATHELKLRWPLEDMLGTDLVDAALRRIETVTGLPASVLDVDARLWLRVESFSLLQVLVYLSGRLADEFGVRFVQLRLNPVATSPGWAQLDLIWADQVISTETVMSWEMDPMRVGNEVVPLSVRDVVERHAGAFWFERERVRHQAFFRLLLPMADPRHQVPASHGVRGESRPEYYDFDLFTTSEQARSLDERPLRELVFTVFDTETTGLDPAQDEIIQIGAARIVNGKLLRRECFEQLVDPRRSISAASTQIHGITPAMLAGLPTIDKVLPAFHAFAQDTVLVGHNAAFDMRFLQLKATSTGVAFEQPVLDTLLLSAVIHPHQDSHRLEAIAERFNLPVVGRHTALGDAMVTAEIFIKLIPLLAERGIVTLGQAREAAQKSYYARLNY